MIEITHLEARSLLQAAADHTLNPEEKSLLDAHLSNCEECNKFAEEISALETNLRKLFHTKWDPQQPDLNLQTVVNPSPAKLLFNNFFMQSNAMGKLTLVAALVLGYLVVANLFGIQSPIVSKETATTLPTPNEFIAAFPASPTPSAQPSLTNSTSQACETITYVVQANDSLASIAYRHGTTSEIIQERNNLSYDMIHTGMELVIPMCESTPSHTATLPEGMTTNPPIDGTLFPTQPQ